MAEEGPKLHMNIAGVDAVEDDGVTQEDILLVCAEIEKGLTGEDIIANDKDHMQVADVVQLMHESDIVPQPVRPCKRLQDVVPNHMLSVLRF